MSDVYASGLGFERVLALSDQQSRISGHLARRGEAYGVQRTKSHVPLAPGARHCVSEDPRFGDTAILGAADVQPEIGTVTEQHSLTIRSRLGVANLIAGELVGPSDHASLAQNNVRMSNEMTQSEMFGKS